MIQENLHALLIFYEKFLFPCPYPGYPPEVVDAGKKLAADVLKEKINEAGLIIKTTYW